MNGRVLVVGCGRSGTSWVGAVLGSGPGAHYLHEPDDPRLVPFASRAARGMGPAPVVERDASGPPTLVRLFDAAFGEPVARVRGQQHLALVLFRGVPDDERRAVIDPSHRPSLRLRLAHGLAVPRFVPPGTRHPVVKTVRMHFALEWLCERWHPEVVVCRRHPLDVVASRLALGHTIPIELIPPATLARAVDRYGVPLPRRTEVVAQTAWITAFVMQLFEELVVAHPEFHVVDHEALCRDPVGQFRDLVTHVGLEWSSGTEAMIVASNRDGERYQLTRIAADQPGKWRRRLTADEARVAAGIIGRFPIGARYDLGVGA